MGRRRKHDKLFGSPPLPFRNYVSSLLNFPWTQCANALPPHASTPAEHFWHKQVGEYKADTVCSSSEVWIKQMSLEVCSPGFVAQFLATEGLGGLQWLGSYLVSSEYQCRMVRPGVAQMRPHWAMHFSSMSSCSLGLASFCLQCQSNDSTAMSHKGRAY